MISRRAFACAVPLAAVSIGRLRAAGVDGKWEAEVQGPQGPMVMKFNLKADGEALTGTVGSEAMGNSDIQDGKISGDAVAFVQVVTRGNREIRLQYDGKLMGDSLELTRSMARPAGAGRAAGGRGQGGAPAGGAGQVSVSVAKAVPQVVAAKQRELPQVVAAKQRELAAAAAWALV